MRVVTVVALSLALASTTLASAVFGTTLATGAIAGLQATIPAGMPHAPATVIADNSPARAANSFSK